jgi:undecaprenyl-diphosphatase
VNRFDETIDAAFEPLRAKPAANRAAAVVSNLADYGIVWVVLALLKARYRGPDRRRAIVALGAAGFSSLFAVRAAKAAVTRERPAEHLEVPVRTPTSSSFPSGHTLAAFCTAFDLAESPAQTAAYMGFATAVAVSRVQLRAHHPSDVMGGAVIGSVLGLGLRPLINLVTPGSRGLARRSAKVGAKGMRAQGYVLKQL